jgi:quinol monooxygenase YgiN
MAGMNAADSVKFQTLMRNAVESSRHSLVRYAPELSIDSGTMAEPKFARVMTIRVKPGKVAEFEDAIKTMLLPAIRQAGIKDYWVDRMVMGGVTGEYTALTPFTKWAELDAWPTTEKMMGPTYKAFMARIAETVDSLETMSAATVPELGYRAQ